MLHWKFLNGGSSCMNVFRIPSDFIFPGPRLRPRHLGGPPGGRRPGTAGRDAGQGASTSCPMLKSVTRMPSPFPCGCRVNSAVDTKRESPRGRLHWIPKTVRPPPKRRPLFSPHLLTVNKEPKCIKHKKPKPPQKRHFLRAHRSSSATSSRPVSPAPNVAVLTPWQFTSPHSISKPIRIINHD